MKNLLSVLIFLTQSVCLSSTREQMCANKIQKEREMQLITAKLSRSSQLGMDTEKEMQALELAKLELEKAEVACPMTKDEACATLVLKKKEKNALIGNISRDPTMNMDRAMKKLKAVTSEYQKAKSICK